MRRELAIGSYSRPTVLQDAHIVRALRDHRLDCQGHAFDHARASAGGSEIWDLWFFVHLFADAVPDKCADNAKSMAFHVCLHRMADVGDPVALTCKFDSLVKALFCYRNELLRRGGDCPTRESSGTVTSKTAPCRAHVHRDDVALLQHPVARNAVDDDLVDGDAGAGREAPVAEERRFCSLRQDKFIYRLVDLFGRYARPYHFACQSTRCRGNFTGLAHNHQFALIFYWNHVIHPMLPECLWSHIRWAGCLPPA